MYAPAWGGEIFDDDRLVVDVIVEAVMRMRASGGPHVIAVNLSLGDRIKPFSGRISTWARALDFLAFNYGILFLVSAGNVGDEIPVPGFVDVAAFEAAPTADRAKRRFKASMHSRPTGACWRRPIVSMPSPLELGTETPLLRFFQV